jgi:hypothetical protein
MTLLVPYRDREEHLKEFVSALGSLHDIVIIEQCDENPFNRGKLINVGYLEMKPDEFAANDIDIIPQHHPPPLPGCVVQVVFSMIQTKDYLGGCTVYDGDTFKRAEGYHNDYFHRAEDNEMMFNLKRMGIPVANCLYQFRELPHPRTSPEFIPELWAKAQLPRTKNMLKTCEYELISKEVKEGYTILRVLL